MVCKYGKHRKLEKPSPVTALALPAVLFLFSSVFGAQGAGEEAKEAPSAPSSLTRLSILPFTASQEADKELGERMAEELEVLLSESGRFRILMRAEMTLEERNRLLKLQVEQGRDEDRTPFQRLSCEEAFVSGSIRRQTDGPIVVYLYVISLATAEKIIALRASCWHENALGRLARAFADEIVDRVDITGRVVKVLGDKFYVEIEGGPEGVKKGDFLEVRHESKKIEGKGGEIDTGEESPFTTLLVEEITKSDHVRCVLKEGEDKKPAEGDLVRLIPVSEREERKKTIAVLPFGFKCKPKKGSGEDGGTFLSLLQEELLVSEGKILGMTVSNPPGTSKYASGETDGRIVCDDLAVDGVLSGVCTVVGKELRIYLKLVLHPQTDVYEEEENSSDEVVRKRVVLPLAEEGKLSPDLATKAAEAVLAAFGSGEEDK